MVILATLRILLGRQARISLAPEAGSLSPHPENRRRATAATATVVTWHQPFSEGYLEGRLVLED
jgi:hypothetical protein